jgi:hypothetical protein
MNSEVKDESFDNSAEGDEDSKKTPRNFIQILKLLPWKKSSRVLE